MKIYVPERHQTIKLYNNDQESLLIEDDIVMSQSDYYDFINTSESKIDSLEEKVDFLKREIDRSKTMGVLYLLSGGATQEEMREFNERKIINDGAINV